jgi:hypothetical protein
MATIPQIRTRLLEGFPEQQADLLAHVVIEAHDDLVNQADFHKLTGVVSDLANVVTDLAEAQKELAESQKELAESQRRTELRVEELAEAQKRTEFRIEELAEAQAGTERAVANLARQVGGLANNLGGSLEDFARDLVPEILEKHWRLVATSAEPEEIDAGRGHREIDLVVRGTIDGRPVMIVCEVAVTAKEVARFMKLFERLRAARPEEDIRVLFFGYRADRKAREAILAAGAAMVFTRGVIIPAA